jgi:hypothetical protein
MPGEAILQSRVTIGGTQGFLMGLSEGRFLAAVALLVWGFQRSVAGLRINPKANFLYAIASRRIFGFEILSTGI